MKMNMTRPLLCALLLIPSALWALPPERKDVRAGNKKYEKGDYANAETDYYRALDKAAADKAAASANVHYNLGNALYKQLSLIDSAALQDPEVQKQIKEKLSEIRRHYAPLAEADADPKQRADAHFNIGNSYMLEQDWKNAVEQYKNALRLNPDDKAAKENLVFAQAMSQNPQPPQPKPQPQDNDDKQDQDQSDDKDQQQPQDEQDKQDDKNKQQDNQPQQQQQQEQESKISKDDAQRMLQAIEQQEKETLDKVKTEKAQKAKKRKSEKYW
jgi:tetratricopeptide (TPR) repeat protein